MQGVANLSEKILEALGPLKKQSGDTKLIEKLETSLTRNIAWIENFNAKYDFMGTRLTASKVAGNYVY